MSQKRFVRIISYEGLEEWMAKELDKGLKVGQTRFHPHGTVKEIARIELRDGEDLAAALRRYWP